MNVKAALHQRRTWILDAVRTRLWPVPAMGIVAAIVVGVALPELDGWLESRLPGVVSQALFGGGPGAAREILSAIAASVMTVTSLTFSLTVVTLQLASGQYSPRLLRTFVRDKFVQRTLALFVATFVYALTVLRTVRDEGEDGPAFVPQLSVTVAYLLVVLSVVALVLFLGHLVRQIRVETMLSSVASDALATADALFEASDGERGRPAVSPPAQATRVEATRPGFIIGIDVQALVAAAARLNAVVSITCKPGDWLVAGLPVGLVWSASGSLLDEDAVAELQRCVATALVVGDERTPVQDVGYAVRQLTDVAVKALSPGINDPTTAVHAIGHLSALLTHLTDRRLGPTVHCGDDGSTRVVVAGPEFADLVDEAVSQPRRYGADDPAVLKALLHLLRALAWSSTVSQRDVIFEQLARMRRTVAGRDFDDVECGELERLGAEVEDAVRGRWPLEGQAP